jgi:two-component system sensor histidine kinase/response regulator
MDSPKIFLNDRQKQLFAGKRILVCDDSRLGQILMRKLLQSAGFKIDVANNGAEGVALAARNEYAAVLMDLIMPVMDGLEATRKIHELRPGLPIAALTGTTNIVEMKKCLDAGLEDFLSKPVDPEALFKMLELFLSEAGAK